MGGTVAFMRVNRCARRAWTLTEEYVECGARWERVFGDTRLPFSLCLAIATV